MPTPYDPADVNRLKWVETVSRLMDSQFRIPGTDFRFGVDPILGMIPFVGDLSTFAVSCALVLTMAKHGVSRNVIIRMVVNIALDLIIGSIPIIGWIFDFSFKANNRNVKLLRRHYHEGKYQGSGTGFLTAVLVIMVVIFGLVVFGLYKLLAWIYQYLSAQW